MGILFLFTPSFIYALFYLRPLIYALFIYARFYLRPHLFTPFLFTPFFIYALFYLRPHLFTPFFIYALFYLRPLFRERNQGVKQILSVYGIRIAFFPFILSIFWLKTSKGISA